MTIIIAGIFLFSGLLGAIPFGLIVTRALGLVDPRSSGSGNIGATNVLRTSGWTPGLITLAGDVFKGVAAVAFVPGWLNAPAHEPLAGGAAAIGAVLGHMYSPFTGFRGGKGVATGLGVFALLMPGPAGWAAVVFLVAAGATKFVSLGSILATLTVPLAGYLMGSPAETAAASAAISALVIWRHKDNIGRLIRGEENRFGSKSN